MLPASPRIASPSLRRLIAATSLVALGAVLALPLSGMAVPARAQSQGPSTSGGNLPYIAAGQSEEEVQKRKRARAEAEDKARQEAARAAADEEKTRQEAARAAQPAEVAPAAPAPTVTATVPPAAPAPSTASVTPTAPAAPKPVATATRPRQGEVPPGVNPAFAGDPRAVVPISPPQQRPSVAAAPPAQQPQHGVVIVRRPMFFGLFGPEVNVTERVVVLTPPANVGSTQAAPRPPAAVGQPKVVSRKPTSNCHYHAAPAAGMGYAHRDVQCHWHENPGEPTLRYVD